MKLVALALASVSWCAASADIIIDNLAQPERERTVVGDGPKERLQAAQAFVTDAQRYTLNYLQVSLGNLTGAPTYYGELRLGEDPTGPTLTTLNFTIPEGEPETVTLLPDVPVTLEPSTSYVLVLGVADAGSFTWVYANSNIWEGPGSFSNYFYSFDDGATWINFGGDFPYRLLVDGTPATCPPDFNGDGLVDSDDFFDFLNAFFAEDPSADFNLDGVVDSDDFFDFLNAFYAGC